MDNVAYEAVKAAKEAVKKGEPRPQDFPEDVWLVLKEMYDKADR